MMPGSTTRIGRRAAGARVARAASAWSGFMAASTDSGPRRPEIGLLHPRPLSALWRILVDRAKRAAARTRPVPARARPERVIAALDGLPHGFCLYDAGDRLVFANAAFRQIFQQPAERAPLGMHARAMVAESVAHGLYAGRDPEAIWAERKAFIARRTAGSFLQTFADGRLIAISHQPQPDGGWAAVYEDVTERRRAETLLHFMAHHDALTGLPNRYLFAERLDGALAALGGGGCCALLCLDLDGFKPVNDHLGHAAGDALLRQVAERLSDGLAPGDVAARLGGDEFAVLLADTTAQTALARAQGLRKILAVPYDLGTVAGVRVGASIGIACAPDHASGAQSLVERADAALYEAKRRGQPCLWSDRLR